MQMANLTLAARQRVDATCDRFESQWSGDARPDIPSFLDPHSGPERAVLLSELVILDLNYRWQHGAIETNARADSESAVDGQVDRDTVSLPDRPLLEDYVSCFPELPPLSELPIALIEEEYRARRRHGDDIRLEKFLARFPGRADVAEAIRNAGTMGSFAGADTQQDVTSSPATTSLPPYAAGRFQVLQLHAQGGLGRVSVARDAELNREVALKEIHDQFAGDRRSQSRFVREAEITGRLEHPGIVPVYGFGRHADGRPYYAMRLIRGQSLRAAIDEFFGGTHATAGSRRLEQRKLLQRVIDACNAIEYAHSRGILHRDLKPENIMLGDYGETLVVDWGLAKRTGEGDIVESAAAEGEQGGGKPMAAETRDGAVIGTPAYMSPEQAAGELERVGPASDVYSLGATLYHLLVGQAPRAKREARGAPDGEIGSDRRPRDLRPEIPQSLEAICQKAMRQAPEDRYHSPRHLADDLEAWLADEPHSAYREPPVVRSWRWIRKHRTWVSMGVVATALIFVGLAIVLAVVADANQRLVGKNRELTISNEAELRQRRDAEQAREQTQTVLNYLVDAFRSPDPDRDGRTITVAESLDKARGQIQQDLQDRPLMEAQILTAIGQTYLALGIPDKAVEVAEHVVDLYQTHLGSDDPFTLSAMHNLVTAYRAAGDPRTVPLARDVYERRKQILGPLARPSLGSRNILADALVAAGQPQEAASILEELQSIVLDRLGPDDELTLLVMNNLPVAYLQAGMPEKSLRLFERIVEKRHATDGDDHPRTLTANINLASATKEMGDLPRTLDVLEDVVPRCRNTFGENHSLTLNAAAQLAGVYVDLGRVDEATDLYEDVYRRAREAYGDDHPVTLRSGGSAAVAYYSAGRLDEAATVWERVLEQFRVVRGDDHPNTLTAMSNLGAAYQAAGKVDEAIRLLEEALELRRKKLGDDHPDTLVSMINLAAAYQAASDYDKAAPLCEELLGLARQKLGADHPLTLTAMSRTAGNFLMQQKYPAAEPLARECLETRTRLMPDSWLRFQSASVLGAALAGQKKYEEAEPLLVEGYEGLKDREKNIPAPARFRVEQARQKIISLYDAWGKPEEAARWK